MEKDEFKIQPYTTKELTSHYGTSPKTFRKWLARFKSDLGTRVGNYYSTKQVQIIVDHLGKPFVWMAALVLKYTIGDDDLEHGGNEGGELK